MIAKSDINNNPFWPKVQKFWHRRYDLFSRFDEGIQVDEVGLYSTTPEHIALEQAKKMNCKTVVDAFCGVGGNAIAFARFGIKVTAIEKDEARLEMARHNAEVYGVADKITFILGDFFKEAPKIEAEGIFLDPSWGGPEYKELEGFKLSNFIPDGNDILNLSFKYFKKVAIKVPDFFDFGELRKFGKEYIIQDNMINGEVGFRTVYFINTINLVSLFNSIRDTHYRIPLKWGEEDNCCSGKHEKLFNILIKNGYDVRYRVCVFLWNSLNLPSELEKIFHEDDCTHTYLEIKIGGSWKILDATWDKNLKNLFHINKWDGKSNTEIALNPVKIFSPKKSLEIVNNQNEEVVKKDLLVNREFYKAFNDWLERKRNENKNF